MHELFSDLLAADNNACLAGINVVLDLQLLVFASACWYTAAAMVLGLLKKSVPVFKFDVVIVLAHLIWRILW